MMGARAREGAFGVRVSAGCEGMAEAAPTLEHIWYLALNVVEYDQS